MSKLWKDVWLDNYNGTSEAHKDLEQFMKKNYKGHQYVPWAVMVKWLYLLDENSELVVVVDDSEDGDSTPVFTSEGSIDNVTSENNDGKEKYKRTEVAFKAHFVKIRCKFLGREFEEIYPIQDNAYNAPNYYDSNMVNKAIQRAKAKLISTATGLAYSLYENGDLQFEDDSPKETKKIVPKEEKVVEAPKKPVTPKNETVDVDNDVLEVTNFIKETPDIVKVLQTLNVDIVKTYGFALNPDDENLYEKVSQLKNAKIFGRALKKRYEDMKNAE